MSDWTRKATYTINVPEVIVDDTLCLLYREERINRYGEKIATEEVIVAPLNFFNDNDDNDEYTRGSLKNACNDKYKVIEGKIFVKNKEYDFKLDYLVVLRLIKKEDEKKFKLWNNNADLNYEDLQKLINYKCKCGKYKAACNICFHGWAQIEKKLKNSKSSEYTSYSNQSLDYQVPINQSWCSSYDNWNPSNQYWSSAGYPNSSNQLWSSTPSKQKQNYKKNSK